MKRSWRWSLIALAGAAVGAAMLAGPEESSSAGSSSGAPPELPGRAQADRRAPSSPPLALPQRQGMRDARADLFAPPAPPPAPAPAAAAQAAAPVAPPNPYRLAGTARFGEKLVILLARGDALVEAKQGEPLDDLYKVRSASAESVALIYAPLGIEQLVEAGSPPTLQ